MRSHTRLLIAVCLACSAVPGAAQDKPPQIQREIIPGSELMTPRERERYRERVRAAATPDAQSQVRDQHVKQMRERARLRGLALPDPQPQKAP